MPDFGRCMDLIHQAPGTVEEKLACASAGLWGNRPLYDFRDSYGGIPTYYIPDAVRASFLLPERKDAPMRKCNSGCSGCSGGTVGGGAYPAIATNPAGSPSGSILNGLAGGSNFGFSINLSGFLLLLLVVAMFWHKGR